MQQMARGQKKSRKEISGNDEVSNNFFIRTRVIDTRYSLRTRVTAAVFQTVPSSLGFIVMLVTGILRTKNVINNLWKR